MSWIFLLTIIFVFLSVSVESVSLILQLNGRKMSRWFGESAFNVHAAATLIPWGIAFILMIILQFEKHPEFHHIAILKYLGLTLLVLGLVVATWGFALLGTKRSLCLNFFEDNVPRMENSLYKAIKNPEDYGFWTALIGFALATASLYNLVIALEFIVLMIPHQMIENVQLKR
jgi:protein-S-isoprenylcysteine O-methyltransferase Ste14